MYFSLHSKFRKKKEVTAQITISSIHLVYLSYIFNLLDGDNKYGCSILLKHLQVHSYSDSEIFSFSTQIPYFHTCPLTYWYSITFIHSFGNSFFVNTHFKISIVSLSHAFYQLILYTISTSFSYIYFITIDLLQNLSSILDLPGINLHL